MNEQELRAFMGDRIRTAREYTSDMSQRTLAARTGIKQTVLSRIERGLSAISAPDLMRISNALGLPVIYFFPGTAPFELSDREIALVTLYRDLPEDLKHLIYEQTESASNLYRQYASLNKQARTEDDLSNMMRNGIIPPEFDSIYDLIAVTLAGLVGGNNHELLPILKSGGTYETDLFTVTIAPPEARTADKSFVDYKRKPE